MRLNIDPIFLNLSANSLIHKLAYCTKYFHWLKKFGVKQLDFEITHTNIITVNRSDLETVLKKSYFLKYGKDSRKNTRILPSRI